MIKINLALKKQSVTVQRTSGNSILVGRANLFKIEDVKELPIRKLLSPLLVGFIAYGILNHFETIELDQLKLVMDKINVDSDGIQKKISNLSNYEALQKQVEGDEKQVHVKLDVILKLISQKKGLVELLTLASEATPKEVWLTSIKMDSEVATFSGYTTGFLQLTEFIKKLNAGGLFNEVELSSSRQERFSTGVDVTGFELKSKRKRD